MMNNAKPRIRWLLPVAVLFLVPGLVLAGCGGGDAAKEITDEEGGVTRTSTIRITEKDLDVPVYPGAKLESDEATVMDSSGPEGKWKATEVLLVTGDPVDKVTEWYRGELSSRQGFQDMSTTEGDKATGMFYFEAGDGDRTVVAEKAADGGTRITLTIQKPQK